MTVDFLKPARVDDVLEIATEPEDVKGASTVVRQRVMRGEELLVEARVRVAFISGGAPGRYRNRCASPCVPTTIFWPQPSVRAEIEPAQEAFNPPLSAIGLR
jgi:hypothetical protein